MKELVKLGINSPQITSKMKVKSRFGLKHTWLKKPPFSVGAFGGGEDPGDEPRSLKASLPIDISD